MNRNHETSLGLSRDAVDTNQPSDRQAAEDARLLERYPNGVVPQWNCALCREMLSESYGGERVGYRVRIEEVTVSADGSTWYAYDDYQGGAFKLYKWITGGDADDEYEHYTVVAKKWRDKLVRRVEEALARQSQRIQAEGGTRNEQ